MNRSNNALIVVGLAVALICCLTGRIGAQSCPEGQISWSLSFLDETDDTLQKAKDKLDKASKEYEKALKTFESDDEIAKEAQEKASAATQIEVTAIQQWDLRLTEQAVAQNNVDAARNRPASKRKSAQDILSENDLLQALTNEKTARSRAETASAKASALRKDAQEKASQAEYTYELMKQIQQVYNEAVQEYRKLFPEP